MSEDYLGGKRERAACVEEDGVWGRRLYTRKKVSTRRELNWELIIDPPNFETVTEKRN